MKRFLIIAVPVFTTLGALPAGADPVPLDAAALATIRAGATVPVESDIQIVGFGEDGAVSSGPPANILVGLSNGVTAWPLILSDTERCAASSCNQVSTNIVVGLAIHTLPSVSHGF